MLDAYKQFWVEGFNFHGRSTRPQFWWPYLVNTAISLVLSFFYIASAAALTGEDSGPTAAFAFTGLLFVVWSLVLIVPQLAVSVRRLHDTDLSGWFVLLGLVPFVGGLILLILFIRPTVWHPNEWGYPG